MRVIAGTARSLPLSTVPSMDIRLTTDRTKETLFNILAPDVFGCRFLDLFAGSGGVGIEALSRGAKEAVFVESYGPAIAVIEKNLAFTHLSDRAVVRKGQVLPSLDALRTGEAFDIIFMDPPFETGAEKEVLRYLSTHPALLAENGIIVVEASLQTTFDYLDEFGMTLDRYKKYKKHAHVFISMNAKGDK